LQSIGTLKLRKKKGDNLNEKNIVTTNDQNKNNEFESVNVNVVTTTHENNVAFKDRIKQMEQKKNQEKPKENNFEFKKDERQNNFADLLNNMNNPNKDKEKEEKHVKHDHEIAHSSKIANIAGNLQHLLFKKTTDEANIIEEKKEDEIIESSGISNNVDPGESNIEGKQENIEKTDENSTNNENKENVKDPSNIENIEGNVENTTIQKDEINEQANIEKVEGNIENSTNKKENIEDNAENTIIQKETVLVEKTVVVNTVIDDDYVLMLETKKNNAVNKNKRKPGKAKLEL